MIPKELKNKPLVEAIFELRWELQEIIPGSKSDPHYKILIGAIYDKAKDSYPHHQQLPTSNIPDELAGYVVQHRFRKGPNNWPLIQIGPGVITLNDTASYTWPDFETRISQLLEILFSAYPNAREELRPKQVLLRYIDSVEFDFEKNHIFDFLMDKLKTKVKVYDKLFEDTDVIKYPSFFDLKFSFPSTRPKGEVQLRFARGAKNNIPALIWETQVLSRQEEVFNVPEQIIEWVRDAHRLTDDWFFKMIEGDLLRRFE